MSELQYLNYKIKLGLAYGLNNVMRLWFKNILEFNIKSNLAV